MSLAQDPSNYPLDRSPADSLANDSNQVDFTLDTFPILYQFIGDDDWISFSDTSLHHYYHQYDPARHKDIDDLHLGNIGSSTRPFEWKPFEYRGFNSGYSKGFEPYFVRADALPFYQMKSAIADFKYSFWSQESTTFEAAFARNFLHGLQFSMAYKNINQVGEFDNQSTRLNGLSGGFRYTTKRSNYQAQLIYHSNVAEQKDNGGLSDTTNFFNGGFNVAAGQPVYSTTAQTRDAEKGILFYQHIHIGGHTDSLGKAKPRFTIRHRLDIGNHERKFFDTEPDANYYLSYLVSDQGIRQYFRDRYWRNSLSIAFAKNLGTKNQERWLYYLPEIGIDLDQHQITNEPFDHQKFWIGRLTANWPLPITDQFTLTSSGYLHWLEQAGDYNIKGSLQWTPPALGQLTIEVLNQSYTAPLVIREFGLTQQAVWQHDGAKTIETQLNASWKLPNFTGTIKGENTIGFKYSLLNKYWVWDEDRTPLQIDNSVSVVSFRMLNHLYFRGVHLENSIVLQRTNERLMALPPGFMKQSLYWEGELFRGSSYLRTGFDHRLFWRWQPPSFFAPSGQFIVQNDITASSYPSLDAYVSLKVRTFRAFFKFENITGQWSRHIFQETAVYPQYFRSGFRLGIGWLFRG